MTIFSHMKCPADLYLLKHQLSIIPLQILHTNSLVSFGSIRNLQKILRCYRIEINRFHKLDRNRWASLLGIGLKELDDHMRILVNASNNESQLENYNDCHNYLSSSIQDAIDTIN
jgi:hypothetical protein